METKHTPGPWHPVNYGGYYMIQSGPFYESADILDEAQTPNAEQNAKLIAAAPQLLEACMNLENDDGAIPKHAWDLIQKAIKSATQ